MARYGLIVCLLSIHSLQELVVGSRIRYKRFSSAFVRKTAHTKSWCNTKFCAGYVGDCLYSSVQLRPIFRLASYFEHNVCVTIFFFPLCVALQLFSSPARMIRPVTNLRTNSREYIGTFEQVGPPVNAYICHYGDSLLQLYMDIAVVSKEFIPNVTTHIVCIPVQRLLVSPLYSWM